MKNLAFCTKYSNHFSFCFEYALQTIMVVEEKCIWFNTSTPDFSTFCIQTVYSHKLNEVHGFAKFHPTKSSSKEKRWEKKSVQNVKAWIESFYKRHLENGTIKDVSNILKQKIFNVFSKTFEIQRKLSNISVKLSLDFA